MNAAVDVHGEVWEAEKQSESGQGMTAWLRWLDCVQKELRATEREMDGELLEGASDLFDSRLSPKAAAARLRGYIDPSVFDANLSDDLTAWVLSA